MRAVFIRNSQQLERMVCEVELHFGPEAGVLDGMKLVGFTLWRSPEGELYITFPSRAFGMGNERRYFDFLRSVEGLGADARKVKAWILAEYRASEASAGNPGFAAGPSR